MKLSALAPVFLLSLGTLTACGGSDSTEPAPTPKDTTAPIVTLTGDSALTLSVGTAYSEQGATANDATDGSVEVITTGAVDSSKVNSYTLTYTATDAAGNNSSTTRTVNVVDDIAPVLVINGDNPLAHNVGDVYTDLSATVSDNIDEASAITITTSGEVNTAVIGAYIITYNATDAAGNAAIAIVRTVNVADLTAPVIKLTGEAIIEHNYGDVYTDQGATATDNIDSSVAATTTDTVLINKIGSYGITYTATDAAGNEATLERIVNVVDIAGPVITLNGESTIILGQGRVYKELGATALDNRDGQSVVSDINSNLNSTTLGEYIVTYSITDSAGNNSTIDRSITVVEPRPFITTWKTDANDLGEIVGENDVTVKFNTSANLDYDFTIDWGDNTTESYQYNEVSQREIMHVYAEAGTYQVSINGVFPHFIANAGEGEIINIDQWGDLQWLSMEYFCAACYRLESDALDTPDLNQVTSLKGMLEETNIFNGDLSAWVVSNVTSMESMFMSSYLFNQDISGWDVSNVTNMKSMFEGAEVFNQNIGAWDVSSVSYMGSMFEFVTLSTANYDALLNSWSQQPLQSRVSFSAGNSRYSLSSKAARDILITLAWDITDGGVTPQLVRVF